MSVREGHFWGSARALSTCEMWTITHTALAMYPSCTVTAFLRKQHYLLHQRPGSLWCCSPNALPSPGFWSQSPLNNLTKHEVLDWRLVSEGALFSHQIKRQSNPILWKHKSIYANYHQLLNTGKLQSVLNHKYFSILATYPEFPALNSCSSESVFLCQGPYIKIFNLLCRLLGQSEKGTQNNHSNHNNSKLWT